MRARIKMLPPSFASHPHLCSPIAAFFLPRKIAKPHKDLGQELPWLKKPPNLTANKQTKKNQPQVLIWS